MAETYSFFTSKELRPQGWLRRQLKLQAEGLCGKLDKVWPDVRDSAWIGGSREGWERVPYWLDGCVPLAYLLEDDDLIARVGRYIDCILERQEPDGWICPVPQCDRKKYDAWAILLLSKVLVRYYECAGDSRIPDVLCRMLRNFYDLLRAEEMTLGKWGSYRWFEGFPALRLLWRLSPEPWIRELAMLLREKGKDYRTAEEQWKRPLNRWTRDTHIVNLCEMLKSEILSCDLLGERESGLAEYFYQLLYAYNGTAVGTFTGDECLSGTSPTQGTELCAVVELMDSMEQLYAYTGNPVWAERLEWVAFNALPAAISEDMWTHQYVQMVNQIDCTPFPGRSHFRTNNSEAHLFGLEPHFGCCTANFGQGWPKLTLSSFLRSADGVVSAVPVPASVQTEWKGVPVTVSLDTEYPFRNTFVYRVEAGADTDFALSVRIPSFAKRLSVNGKACRRQAMLSFRGFAKGTTELRIAFEAEPVLERRPDRMYCLRRGSLVFALPIASESAVVEYEKNGVERKFPYCDYHIRGTGDWNVALTGRQFRVEECAVGEIPFSGSQPPLRIAARLCHIDWGLEDGFETVCARVPQSRKPLDEPRERILIPYGCARLRMTELPLVRPD